MYVQWAGTGVQPYNLAMTDVEMTSKAEQGQNLPWYEK